MNVMKRIVLWFRDLAWTFSTFCSLVCVSCGCVSLYTRCPTTNPEIEMCYQSTMAMAGITVIGSFPQMMSDSPGDGGFRWENCLTIPFIGLPCFVDTCLEACVDTVCLPADYFIARAREERD